MGRRALMFMAFGLIILISTGCGSPTSPSVPHSIPPGAVLVTGTVHFITLEGGFWAVRGDDGVTYDPMNGLARGFQRENLRVSMIARVRTDMGGVHMVGPIVEIISIDPL